MPNFKFQYLIKIAFQETNLDFFIFLFLGWNCQWDFHIISTNSELAYHKYVERFAREGYILNWGNVEGVFFCFFPCFKQRLCISCMSLLINLKMNMNYTLQLMKKVSKWRIYIVDNFYIMIKGFSIKILQVTRRFFDI